MKIKFTILTSLLLTNPLLYGDVFHYRNILIGDRAVGLGGAYGGISDDSSGVFYNPAGLAFAISNDISGSANAFYWKTIKYKKTIKDSDFTEKSNGSLPSFFGGLQKLDHLVKGLVAAFGVYSTDNEIKDQNDLIENQVMATKTDGRCGGATRKYELLRFHRTVNQNAATVYMGGAAGIRINNNLALGFGMNYVTINELVQNYQDTKSKTDSCPAGATSISTAVAQSTQNSRQKLSIKGLQPVFGIQGTAWGKVSFGLTVKPGFYLSQEFVQTTEQRDNNITKALDDDLTKNGTAHGDAIVDGAIFDSVATKPLGSSMPLETRLGMAYFHSTKLLVSLDVDHYSGAENVEDIKYTGKYYLRKAVTNFAVGAEYYLTASIPFRLGVFTNNDARPKIDPSKSNQDDHVDYKGLSTFLAWVQPNSQIGAGFTFQNGKGESQKLGGRPDVQQVEGNSTTFVFSATHGF